MTRPYGVARSSKAFLCVETDPPAGQTIRTYNHLAPRPEKALTCAEHSLNLREGIEVSDW